MKIFDNKLFPDYDGICKHICTTPCSYLFNQMIKIVECLYAYMSYISWAFVLKMIRYTHVDGFISIQILVTLYSSQDNK